MKLQKGKYDQVTLNINFYCTSFSHVAFFSVSKQGTQGEDKQNFKS